MAEYITSLDGGNSSIKVIINEEIRYKYSNVYGGREDVDYRLGSDMQSKNDGANFLDVKVTIGTKKSEKNIEKSFLFGDILNQFPNKRTNRPNIDKYNDEQLVANMITTLGHSILRTMISEKRVLNENTSTTVDLSVGLPFNEWVDEAKEKHFKEYFKGTHKIEFLNPYFQNVLGIKELEITVENLEVNLEGYAAIKLIYSSIEPEIKDDEKTELLETVRAIADIGAFTTDVVACMFVDESDDSDEDIDLQFQYLHHYSFGHKAGIGTAMERVIKEYNGSLTRKQIETALSKKGMRKGSVGWVPATDINIKPSLDKYCADLGDEIANKLADKFDPIKEELTHLYITGGGSYYSIVVDTIKAVMKKRGFNIEVEAVKDIDPVFANALGYYYYLEQSCTDGE